MTNNPKLKLEGIHQIGIVVRDLDKAMRAYWRILGIGPWRVYSHGNPMVPVTTYRGRPENYRHRVALADVGGMQIELIQHVEGDSIYKEFLTRFGEGVQHLGVFVENAQESAKEAEAAGFNVIQSGTGHGPKGDGAYFYIDTAEELGVVYELIQIRERTQPEKVYP
jgi:methylmalonyl-CoA/ethylmalonyl-CoA epimerase